MSREDLLEWVRQQYGTDPDYPWKDENAVLRHQENHKWYGLVMKVGGDKLGMADQTAVNILNVKCDPILIGSLRTQPGFFPAYHMNKDSWVSILLSGPEQDETIKNLVSMSYKLTAPKKKD